MWLGSGLIGVVLPGETPSVKPNRNPTEQVEFSCTGIQRITLQRDKILLLEALFIRIPVFHRQFPPQEPKTYF